MSASLVYKNALMTGATAFLTSLDTLLTNSFSPIEPRGLGWTKVFNSEAGNSTTLFAGINTSTTTINATTTGFSSSGTILIDAEQISYSGKTPTSFTGCVRGNNNTTAATHTSTTIIRSVADKLYFSLGSGGSERILLRLTAASNDTYIDRQICQVARVNDGYMNNNVGATSSTRITLGSSQFEFWAIANQDFIHLITLTGGATYSHYYSGIINRFAPNQNSSLYGLTAPSPSNTTTPTPAAFTIGANTTLFLRTGFDNYGGYGADNLSFIAGQKLYIIDQSLGTSTTGNQGIVVLNSANVVQNTINVSYVSGDNTFSSFAIIGIDPQPVALSTNSIIRGSVFLMLDDFIGEAAPQFNAVAEFSAGSGLPPENIQDPNSRGVFITMPIRLYNTQEIRGTLYGSIDIPVGSQGAQESFQTFDGLYRFINFPDGTDNMIGVGSII